MIRKHKATDLDRLMEIWSSASSLAHSFLHTGFVEKVRTDMKELYLPDSQTWVFEEDETIIGFISMLNNEIGGLFVHPNEHSRGVGTALVNFVSPLHDNLEVEVFEKNSIGRSFYHKYGFICLKTYKHEQSREIVLRMIYN